MNQRGFTFIELTLSIVVIGIGLFGLLSIFQSVVIHGSNSEEFVTAANLTSVKLEEVIADKANQGYSYAVNGNYNTNENLTAPYVGFNRTLNITEVDPVNLTTVSANSGYKRVTVTVTSPGGAVVTYETLLTLWGVFLP
jgi:prepilin-type N-terminal cleavage/methylation domain-containing protein